MFNRNLNILKSNSFFLFGARGTGKTTLLGTTFSPDEALTINLLDRETFTLLDNDSSHLRSLVKPAIREKKWVLIDEVQKIPALLDLVHDMIEKDGIKFGLIGSSARKLKRGAANLLAGRAFVNKLFPLLPDELGNKFEIQSYLSWGGLPKIYDFTNDEEKRRFLLSYVDTYLQEEIVAEQIVRKLSPFRRFLQVAAQTNSNVINYTKIASDIQSDPNSVKSYFQILEDTLLGFFLEPYHTSIRKRQRQNPKFYLIDPGILRAQSMSLDVPVKQGNYGYGKLFETFIVNTIRASLEYTFSQHQLSYIRTKDNAEIDLIIERSGQPTVLIEIKSGTKVRDEELRNLSNLAKDIENSKAFCFYQGNLERVAHDVSILNWQKGLSEIGL